MIVPPYIDGAVVLPIRDFPLREESWVPADSVSSERGKEGTITACNLQADGCRIILPQFAESVNRNFTEWWAPPPSGRLTDGPGRYAVPSPFIDNSRIDTYIK